MPQPVSELLFADGPAFDFFQAVRLLERLHPERKAVGREALPVNEVVRFRSLASLAFPPSSIYEIEAPNEDRPFARIFQTFLGLTGPSGVLPRHYTQQLLDLGRDVKGPERRSLGDFLALFDHRVVSLFYRAWEKYRFFIPYERGEASWAEPDAFTSVLYSLIGLGTPHKRGRLRVAVRTADEEQPERPVARVEDLALLYYAGFLAQRPRNAGNLEAMLADYFEMPVAVRQFQGQWLLLEKTDQTCLGSSGTLGVSAVAGDRVWDVQAKFRIKVGPLKRSRFEDFLPDRSDTPRRKSLFLLAQLVRLYAGPELDFDLQLVLEAAEVPPCRIGGEGFGARLGWNTWVLSRPRDADADDPVFVADENVWLN